MRGDLEDTVVVTDVQFDSSTGDQLHEAGQHLRPLCSTSIHHGLQYGACSEEERDNKETNLAVTFDQEQSLVGSAEVEGLDDDDGVAHLVLQHSLVGLQAAVQPLEEPGQLFLQL